MVAEVSAEVAKLVYRVELAARTVPEGRELGSRVAAQFAGLLAELDRLAAFLHARQLHPDWSYCVSYEDGGESRRPTEGWVPNPHPVSTMPVSYLAGGRRELFWMRPNG